MLCSSCLERHQQVPLRSLSCPVVRSVCGQAELAMLVPCWALCHFCCWFWVCASCHWEHHTTQAVQSSPAPGEGSDVVFFSCYVWQHFIWRIMPSFPLWENLNNCLLMVLITVCVISPTQVPAIHSVFNYLCSFKQYKLASASLCVYFTWC